MGLYWNIPVQELDDQSLLDQHRTCHREWSRLQYQQSQILRLHDLTVMEMLARGIRHESPLQGELVDRSDRDPIAVLAGHSQLNQFGTCPMCARKSALILNSGRFDCRFCKQGYNATFPEK